MAEGGERMNIKDLRARCEARLRSIEPSIPFDPEAFCRLLAARRGRPIRLCPVRAAGAVYGAWLAAPSADYLFYEAETTPFHRRHSIVHEACHMWCEHRQLRSVSRALAAGLGANPDELRPEAGGTITYCDEYAPEDELEAELLASLLLYHADRAPLALTGRGGGAAPRRFAVAYEGSWRHYRAHRRLDSLWRGLHDASPVVAPRPARARLDSALSVREFGLRLYQRVIQIRDGAVALRPYLNGAIAEHASALCLVAGVAGGEARGVVEATCLASALRARTFDQQPARSPATPLSPPNETLESELSYLQGVARAYQHSPIVALALAGVEPLVTLGHLRFRRAA